MPLDTSSTKWVFGCNREMAKIGVKSIAFVVTKMNEDKLDAFRHL